MPRLGTAVSYGVETLSVMRKGEWVDYDIIVAFHPPNGESVQIRLESDNVVSVPAEATAAAGTGELTFAGYTDGVRQISVSQIYRVAVSAGAGVKLDYQRDVNIVIKKLEDAIASMTTT